MLPYSSFSWSLVFITSENVQSFVLFIWRSQFSSLSIFISCTDSHSFSFGSAICFALGTHHRWINDKKIYPSFYEIACSSGDGLSCAACLSMCASVCRISHYVYTFVFIVDWVSDIQFKRFSLFRLTFSPSKNLAIAFQFSVASNAVHVFSVSFLPLALGDACAQPKQWQKSAAAAAAASLHYLMNQIKMFCLRSG